MAQNWFPGHMNKALKEIEAKIPVVDAVIEIVDARAPYSTQNPIFRRLLKDKTTIYVLSKTDLADPEVSQLWAKHFAGQRKNKFVISIDKQTSNITNKLINVINDATADAREKQKARGIVNPQLNVLVLGLPNVGKSTFINKIVKSKTVKAGNKPGLTRGLQIIKLNDSINLIDTPGIMPNKIENESVATNLVAINTVKEDVFPRERMAARAARYVYNNYPGAIEERYRVKIGLYPPIEINQTIKIFERIAKNNKWVLLDDMPDSERVMQVFLKDLQDGKIGRISYETPDMIAELVQDQNVNQRLTRMPMSQVSDNKRHLFDLEYSKNKYLVSGSDEVGRGAMAGPVVVASCILPNDYDNPAIKDSKQLSKKKREELFEEIKKVAIDYRIVFVDEGLVDKWNPKKSSDVGMIQTVERLDPKPEISLIDAEKLIDEKGYHFIPLIKGDDKSQTIGAASILAKVSRDRLMYQYGEMYPEYGFENHVGYVTKKHQEAVEEFGVLPIHRKSYAPIKRIIAKKKNS